MKLITYRKGDGPVKTGVVLDERVLDISAWLTELPISTEAKHHNAASGITAPTGGIMRWLQCGPDAIEKLAAHVAHASQQAMGVGRNYADHAKETGVTPFEKPRIIFKVPSSVTAANADVPRPTSVSKMDFETELAVVIGGYGKNVAESDALALVAGYTILNDVSAREFQFDVSPPQTTFAKSMDGFAPMGPWLVTRDEIADPQALALTCTLNGQQMQHGHTAEMLFPVATLIAYLSQFMTLEPGDVIGTGTPAGIGAFRKPPVYLQPGDQLRMEISHVGVMEHKIK